MKKMNRLLRNSLRFSPTYIAILVLSTMMLMSSAQGVFEECASETGQQEIELVIVRCQERTTEKNDDVAKWRNWFSPTLDANQRIRNRFFIAFTERAMLNGLGTYLII